MLAEGTAAPDFQIGDWSLSGALKKGAVLLAFFKISCPTCQFTFPFLQRLADAAQPGAPQLVAISQDDAVGTEQFRRRFGPTAPPLLDAGPRYPASTAYGLTNVPALYLVEADGRISMAINGFSKQHLEALGERFGTAPFREGERIPAAKPG